MSINFTMNILILTIKNDDIWDLKEEDKKSFEPNQFKHLVRKKKPKVD